MVYVGGEMFHVRGGKIFKERGKMVIVIEELFLGGGGGGNGKCSVWGG
jgi:hypothetical protein